MRPVETVSRTIDSYRPVVGDAAVDTLLEAARPLRGLRVMHVNATPDGGGVAEILQAAVPLLCDLGLDSSWTVLSAEPEFYDVTKRMHNLLQGADGQLSDLDRRRWADWQELNATILPADVDLVVVHDPQPLGLASAAGGGAARWIWRLHIDTSHPDRDAWRFLRPYLEPYSALVFTLDQFAPPDVPDDRVRVIAPAIDPLDPKNRSLPIGTALSKLAGLGLDARRPLIAQVARLDPWKDPIGVIDAYRLVRGRHEGLQLALLGATEADDDPEAVEVARAVRAHAGKDPDIHVLTDPALIGDLEVGAVQLLAQVVFQKSLREGFGLTVSEAMWKSTPVVAGRVGGIPLQLQDGQGGFLVDSVEEAAERCDWLLSEPARARAIGAAGRAVIQERFLITRLLADELTLYREVLASREQQALRPRPDRLAAAG
ncbi:MAG: glycosyltransferase [Chloroflexi bacterium]|nr:glycosyltransferase [Chloroflexota bacterium]